MASQNITTPHEQQGGVPFLHLNANTLSCCVGSREGGASLSGKQLVGTLAVLLKRGWQDMSHQQRHHFFQARCFRAHVLMDLPPRSPVMTLLRQESRLMPRNPDEGLRQITQNTYPQRT